MALGAEHQRLGPGAGDLGDVVPVWPSSQCWEPQRRRTWCWEGLTRAVLGKHSVHGLTSMEQRGQLRSHCTTAALPAQLLQRPQPHRELRRAEDLFQLFLCFYKISHFYKWTPHEDVWDERSLAANTSQRAFIDHTAGELIAAHSSGPTPWGAEGGAPHAVCSVLLGSSFGKQ